MNLQMSMKWNSIECRESDMKDRLAQAASGGVEAINARLNEIEGEWSAGRATKSILGVCILVGTILALTVNGWWVIVPVVAGLSLFEYMFASTSMLVRLMEGFGFRTRSCIEQEKFALRTLRGDFRTLPTILDIEDADDISRLEGEGGIVVERDERKVDSKDAVQEVIEASRPI